MTSLAQKRGESPDCSINDYMHRVQVYMYQMRCWRLEKKVCGDIPVVLKPILLVVDVLCKFLVYNPSQ